MKSRAVMCLVWEIHWSLYGRRCRVVAIIRLTDLLKDADLIDRTSWRVYCLELWRLSTVLCNTVETMEEVYATRSSCTAIDGYPQQWSWGKDGICEEEEARVDECAAQQRRRTALLYKEDQTGKAMTPDACGESLHAILEADHDVTVARIVTRISGAETPVIDVDVDRRLTAINRNIHDGFLE